MNFWLYKKGEDFINIDTYPKIETQSIVSLKLICNVSAGDSVEPKFL